MASLLAIVLGVVTTANADVVVGAATSSSASAASLTFSHTVGSGSNRLLLVVCNVTGQGKGSTL